MTEQTWARGRIALVTGATSGFGEAMARRLVAGGAKVIATGRRVDRLQALADELRTPDLLTRELDVRSPDSIDALLPGLPAGFQAIDVLYNNAGLALGLGKAHEASLDDWTTMIDTNVTGLVRITRAVLPGMVERNCGDVINLSSVAASYPYPGGNVYGATKAFVRQFSLNLRADLLGTKVRVTSIEPGMADTEFSLVRFAGDRERADNVYKGVHAMSADDVALVCESVLRLPAHINVNTLELMPVQQAFSPFAVDRGG
ncbi:MAG: SDR family NAD(P)-dependent oxidoreductase [Phenylobacterium sp.]|uniref:SDR family NAD(P)-dependent oxidoreductase n=1 Tax=Phenylobacterium sp. TaxID=1871053 RepID=UPI001A43ACA5|nr:SDR family NAD(P)-dependent oxidoreductase [Phenylobacterium sp.]MBL8774106.1 SDR family NAD(P)-dependent oxidoreductase [Phenylobacterium sp.]